MSGVEQPLAGASSRAALMRCLQADTAQLLGGIRVYVHRAGLAQGYDISAVALEILQETAVEALAHADRFDPTRQPTAWLLGIALNLVRRRRASEWTRLRHEVSAVSLAAVSADTEPMSELDLLDALGPPPPPDAPGALEEAEELAALLALVPSGDREVLRLGVVDGLERDALAKRLGTSPGAARVRLHRALARLRTAWRAGSAEDDERGNG
jgi:RNA polymerase sigma-70 factor (ECF subfamily)